MRSPRPASERAHPTRLSGRLIVTTVPTITNESVMMMSGRPLSSESGSYDSSSSRSTTRTIRASVSNTVTTSSRRARTLGLIAGFGARARRARAASSP